MSKWQKKSLKKSSGGRKWSSHKKRKYEMGRESADTEIGEKKKDEISVRGNEKKSRLLSIDSANITSPETGKNAEAKIKSVLENPADPHLARRDIITKGAIVETEVGKARITSRPGQEGSLNAVLLEGDLEKKSTKKKKEKEETEKKSQEESDEDQETKDSDEESES